jgi:hypothetical protein
MTTAPDKGTHKAFTLTGWLLVINDMTGNCLDVMAEQTEDGSSIIQFPPHGGDNQRWQFFPTSDGYVEIVAKHSGKALDDATRSEEDGGVVHQWSRHKEDSQQWKLTPTEDGCFFISSKVRERYLDAAHDCQKIHLWSFHGGKNQRWRLRHSAMEKQKSRGSFPAEKQMSGLDNTLDLKMVFAVYADQVVLLHLESERLPWVSEAGASASLPIRSIIDGFLIPALNNEATCLEAMRGVIQQTSTRLRYHLEREFGIFCELRLHFRFEEQNKEALGKLAERMRLEDPEAAIEKLRASCRLGQVDFKDVTEISWLRAGAITEDNFNILEPNLEVLPGKEVSFVISSKEPVICREFQLFCGEHQVLRHQVPVHFDAESQRTIRLPGIPVKTYRHLLGNDSGELLLRLTLEGRDVPVVLTQRLRQPRIVIDRVPASLLLDVGSIVSKFMVVDIEVEPSHTDVERSELAARLRGALESASEGSAQGVSLEAPQPTHAFVENYGLSHAPKKVLDQYEDEELASHFSRSISGLATRFYKRERRLISDVFWAFPNTKNRNFAKINESVNRTIGGAIMGIAHIVPEAHCLRLEFAESLNVLAEAARSAKQAKETAEEENKRTSESQERIRHAWNAYQSRPWYEKVWKTVTMNRPTDPARSGLSFRDVPSMQDWHREFARLDCDPELSDFVVFDAGGYSLDVYGRFPAGSGTDVSESFPAGSAKINAAIIEKLSEINPGCSDQEHADKAEEIKCYICGNPSDSEQHPLYDLCRDSTSKVYEKHFESVLELLRERVQGKGFPIILTGGGSRNQFLQRLMEEKLSYMGLHTVPINSPLLYATMRKAGTTSRELKLFLCMASAFHPGEEVPRMAPTTDILGGLAQLAFKNA